MKLYIKNMVSARCMMAVKTELKQLGLHYIMVELGNVEIMEDITTAQREFLKKAFLSSGLELMVDKKAILIEKIKNVVIDFVHHANDEPLKTNFSDYLTEKLRHNYTYLANIFSETMGTTIEHFIISHKIERAKELLVYNEHNLTEIAYRLNYSSVAHLSNQFKKITGLTPSFFRQLKDNRRSTLDTLSTGNLKYE